MYLGISSLCCYHHGHQQAQQKAQKANKVENQASRWDLYKSKLLSRKTIFSFPL
jgi:hypothetical protein